MYRRSLGKLRKLSKHSYMIHSKLRLGREHLFFWFNNPRHPGPPAEVWYLDPATCIYLKYRTSEGIWMSRVTWCCIKEIMKSQLLVLVKWDGWRLYFTKCVNEGINCSCYHRCKKCTVVTTACVGEKFRCVLPWKLTCPHCIPYWHGPFLRDMLILGHVYMQNIA